ncbi:uncharacterized protein BDZ99DRAFT_343145, partial [Mytilinidion resinicola]
GGVMHPWKSAAVISAITLGFLGLIAFVLLEIYAPLREPFIPMYLFANFQSTASVILLGLGAGVYCAFSIVWPVQVAMLYGNSDDSMYAGYLSCLKDVGVAGGTGGTVGTVRAGLCAVLIAIYVTVFTNRLTTTVSKEVPPALIAAGLPATSIADFLTAFTTGATDLLMIVPGDTASVIAAGSASYKQANADAYRTVYLTTIAFSSTA